MAAYDDDSWQHQTGDLVQHTESTTNPNPFQQSKGTHPEIAKQGWAMKKGPQSYTGWKKRFLRLTTDQQLSYFTDDDLMEQKGTVPLNGLNIYQIQKSSKSADSKQFGLFHSLYIFLQNVHNSFVLCTDSPSTLHREPFYFVSAAARTETSGFNESEPSLIQKAL